MYQLMTRLFLFALIATGLVINAGCGGGGDQVDLQGAGATFPAPLYKKWFAEYMKTHSDVEINYQALGSGAGIAQFTKGSVFFGASDAAMKDDEIEKVKGNVLMLPLTAGAVVITYNLPGVSDLKLSRKAYTKIFDGSITKWNDPEIAKHNPDKNLPDKNITVVVRADSSGTTFVFTNHLAEVSPEFKSSVGAGKTVSWPKGDNFTAQQGNSNVTAQVKQNEGSVGYVEFGYASENGLEMATLENLEGEFVKPTLESGMAALAGQELPENMRLFIVDPAGKDSYPIVTYTWLLVKKEYEAGDAKKVAILKDLIKYCLGDGQKLAPELGYIPLPEAITKKVLEKVESIKP